MNFAGPTTYTSGNNTGQQEDSRKFLEALGVHVINESDKIIEALRSRYSWRKDETDLGLDDIQWFSNFLEENPKEIALFKRGKFFRCKDGVWRKGDEIYLDVPFLETGLWHYYCVIKTPKRWALSDSYFKDTAFKNTGFVELFVNFARIVGAQVGLEITSASCWNNPQKNDLAMNVGGWSDSYGINRDYTIDGLKEMLALKDEAVSKLIWRAVCETKIAWMKAEYRNNSQHPIRRAPSQLFARLRDCQWIPQKGGAFPPASE